MSDRLERAAGALPASAGLTIAVNAPPIAVALLKRGGFRVVVTGGKLGRETGVDVRRGA